MSFRSTSRIIALLATLLLFSTLAVSVFSIISIPSLFLFGENGERPLDLHFSLFLPATASHFFREVEVGARKAAAELEVALSLHPIGNDTLDFRMARYSGIDGAIVYSALDEGESRKIIADLEMAGIPVVLIEHGPAGPTTDPPRPFVGTNNYDLGRKIGELIAGTGFEPLHTSIVYSEKSPGIASEKELVELGIRTVLKERLSSPLSRNATGLNPLDAKSLTTRIVRTEPWINTIIFTDTNDTLAALQAIIDLNLVGDVQIIGFGLDEEIQGYLDRNILAGTVVVNPGKIGFNAVKVLTGLKRDGYSAGFVDTGVEVYRSSR